MRTNAQESLHQARGRAFSSKLTSPHFRASALTWFPTPMLEKDPSPKQLARVFGKNGQQITFEAPISRKIFAHVAARGYDLCHTAPSNQMEIVTGLHEWFSGHMEKHHFDPLESYENVVNSKIQWQPGSPVSARAFLFHLLLSLHQKGKKDRQAAKLLDLMPKKPDLFTSECLLHLLEEKNEAVRMTGAPARLAIFPIHTNDWNALPENQRPQASFVALYLPLDLKLSSRLRKLAGPLQTESVRNQDAERIGPQFFDPTATFPGALAYARVSIYEEGESQSGIIHMIHSDASAISSKFISGSICADFIPLLGMFMDQLACTHFYFPTWDTALENADPLKVTNKWRQSAKPVYQQGLEGFDPKPVVYRGQEYRKRNDPYLED